MLPVKILWATNKWLNQFSEGLFAVHNGIWLGLLERPALQQTIGRFYSKEVDYVDSSYNLSGFFLWEAWAMGRYFGDCRSILVAAAGGGREVIALAKRGFHVEAFECDEALLQASQDLFTAENINSRILFVPPDQVPADLGEYDGLIVGWGAYSHIGGREKRVRFLQQLRLHASPGSPILLSFFTRGLLARRHRIRFATARIVGQLRRRNESVELGDDLVPMFVHRFWKEEIEDELASGGFELIYFARQPYGHAIARVV